MRAAWLEPHDEFEGVGAHEFNHRYDWVDEGEHDYSIIPASDTTPALIAARAFLATVTVPIRFDGADISHYQTDAGPVNWAALKNAPSWWFGFKLTQSTGYLDPTAVRSRAASFACGLTHRGAYHWLSSTTDPQQQAAWYLSKLGLLSPGEFVMLDAEEGGITVAGVLAWCEAVEAQTHRPAAVYTGAYVAGGSIWQSTRVRDGKFGPRPMILAAYTTEARARALPGVRAYPWSSWQFSSNGPVAGITGRCDMNRVDDRAVYDRAAAITTAPPIEVDPPVVPPPTVPAVPNPKEEPVRFVADSQSQGSAAVELVYGADHQPHHTMVGFNTAEERAVWAAVLPVHAFDDATYQAMAQSAAQV